MELIRSRGGLLLVMCAGLVLAASCAADEPTQPAAPGGQELYDFTSLDEMVATSDAVIEGTVLSSEPGRVVGGDADPVQFIQLNVKVDELLYGSLPEIGEDQTVLLEESAGSVEKENTQGIYGSAAGDHGFYFLGWKDESSFYYLINSEGRFLVQDAKVVALNKLDEWALDLETLSPEALKSRILEAADAAEAGEVAPAAPGPDY